MEKYQLDGDRVFVVDGFLTSAECDAFVALSEGSGYEDAPISTAAGAVLAKDVRDNARLIRDDRALAEAWWARARPFLPARIGQCDASGFNERFRFYRYDPGQKFSLHRDGFFQGPNGDRSRLTFLVYLNDGFAGGETKFYGEDAKLRIEVRPGRGRALVFAHQELHEGAPVTSGRKYVLRTDVMYANP
jgi:predicted 2-oxoglutarate/Fe(II)-dependent dioxygenase YbiX